MGLAHVYDVLEIEYDVFETALVTIALETALRLARLVRSAPVAVAAVCSVGPTDSSREPR